MTGPYTRSLLSKQLASADGAKAKSAEADLESHGVRPGSGLKTLVYRL
jgi:hypothetical protein